jgi:hypothetical protein
MYKIILSATVVIFLFSCKPQKADEKMAKEMYKLLSSAKRDSTKKDSNSNHPALLLTEDLAQHVLYKYFKGKGYLTKPETEQHPKLLQLPKNKNNSCIDFDDFILFNNDQSALVGYYKYKPGEVGNCVQAYHAIISTSEHGYEITKEIFLPNSIVVDSVKNNFVYGYEYNCIAQKIVKKVMQKLY